MLAMWEYLPSCKGIQEKLTRIQTQAIMVVKGHLLCSGYPNVRVTNPNLGHLRAIIVSILSSQQLNIQKHLPL